MPGPAKANLKCPRFSFVVLEAIYSRLEVVVLEAIRMSFTELYNIISLSVFSISVIIG